MDDIGVPTALPALLDQINGPVDLFLAHGAYDGNPTSDLLAARFGSMIEVIIPPTKKAVSSPNVAQHSPSRDCHIAEIESKGAYSIAEVIGLQSAEPRRKPDGPTAIGSKLKGTRPRRIYIRI